MAVSIDGLALGKVRKQTPEICLAAVNKNGLALRYADIQNDDICFGAIANCPRSIQYANDIARYADAAFKLDHSVLRYIEQTPERCLAAINDNVDNIRYINESMKIHPAVWPAIDAALRIVPRDIGIEDIERDGMLIRYVPHKTEKLCRLAVKSDSKAIAYIESPSEEVCLMAVQDDAYNLRYIAAPTPRVIEAALEQNGMILPHIGEQTEEHCITAVMQNGRALQFVKTHTRNIEIAAVAQSISAVEFVDNITQEIHDVVARDRYVSDDDDSFPTDDVDCDIDICFESNPIPLPSWKYTAPEDIIAEIHKDPFAICGVAPDLITEDMLYEAVKLDGTLIQHFSSYTAHIDRFMPHPRNFKGIVSERVCIAAVSENGDALGFIRSPTREMCMIAVANCGGAIVYVDDADRTLEMWVAAARNDPGVTQLITGIHTGKDAVSVVRAAYRARYADKNICDALAPHMPSDILYKVMSYVCGRNLSH